MLVTDVENQRVVVFGPSGKFIRQFGGKGDGPGQFAAPTGIAAGPDGSIYVADYDQDRIQKFSEEGKFLLQWGSSGAGNEQFNSPNGLAIDQAGNVYAADFYNKVIKVFDATGKFLKTIGRPGQWYLGELDYPTDVDVGGERAHLGGRCLQLSRSAFRFR